MYQIDLKIECQYLFSSLASSLLNSIADFLESGIDDFTSSLYNLTITEDSEETVETTERDSNNNDSDTNDEVQDEQKMRIQEIRSGLTFSSVEKLQNCVKKSYFRYSFHQ
jgi:hypothetical protein